MAKFSGSEAVGAGFRIISKHPVAVLIWGLVYVLLTGGPVIYGYSQIWPDVLNLIHAAGAKASGGDPSAVMAAAQQMRLRMLPYQMLQLPLGLVAVALIYGAIYRAVLEPADSAAAYLRLGARELWLVLVTIVAFILAIVAFVPIVLCAVLAATAIAHALPETSRWLPILIIVLATIAFVLWLGARFSLAFPASFAQSGFKLFDSWSLTRGRGWKIVGVMLGLVLIAILIEVLVSIVMVSVVLAGVGVNWQSLHETVLRSPETLLHRLTPWLIVLAVAYVAVAGALHTIFIAPFASIYRQLTEKPRGPADFGAA